MTRNKNRTLLFHLLVNCIYAILALQILFSKDEYTFSFSNILLIDLCNSSANCRFLITSLLRVDLTHAAKVSYPALEAASPQDFLSNI